MSMRRQAKSWPRLDQFLTLITATLATALMNHRSWDSLSVPDRGRAVDEWTAGKEYILAEYTIRIGAPWKKIPLRLFGMAHEEADCWRDALVDSLAQYEALTPDDDLDIFVCIILSRAGPLRRVVIMLLS